MTEADLYAFMARHRLGILGTICPNATPQSALMGIAITPQLEIVFDTVKSSRKYPNLDLIRVGNCEEPNLADNRPQTSKKGGRIY